jgi:hypothetical protein
VHNVRPSSSSSSSSKCTRPGTLSFDTFYDGRNGFQFIVTAAGELRDGTAVDEAQADWSGNETRAAQANFTSMPGGARV